MKNRLRQAILILTAVLLSSVGLARSRHIALTIDDLPFVGEEKNYHLSLIIDALKTEEIPATGFVIAGNVRANNWDVLHKFREAGLSLGNHTLSHANINKLNTNDYLHEIDEADKILAPVISEPKFFRYPYMAMGAGEKKQSVLNYLQDKHYQNAPITIDSKDYLFNQLLLAVPESKRREFLTILRPTFLAFIWQQTLKAEERNKLAKEPDKPQILLVHANLLTAYLLPDIIAMYRENEFDFIPLEVALNKPDDKPVKLASTTKRRRLATNIASFFAWD